MKIKINFRYAAYLVMMLMFITFTAEAQKMKHKTGGGKQNISKSNVQQKNTINGGHQKSSDRDLSKKEIAKKTGTDTKRDINKTNIKEDKKVSKKDKTTLSNNKVNIDKSKKNVNINVDNSKDINVRNNRNTVVRRNTRVYNRPPHVYGGYHYNCYHPYRYHPYHPYYWGPVWHPWGFVVATLAVTAIVISVENQQYHYDQGVYYVQSGSGYSVVQAPVGATITTLPSNSQTVVVNETTNNYYYGGTYYEKSDGGYTVVPPTAGTIVENLPEGAEEVKVGDVTYVKYGETYYQPIEKDGKNMYEVVNVEQAEE